MLFLSPRLFAPSRTMPRKARTGSRTYPDHLLTLIVALSVVTSLAMRASAQTLQLFVADFDHNRVDMYNTTSGALTPFVTAGSGGLVNPFGILFAPDGSLLVGDTNTHTIKRYSGANGAYLGDLVSAGSGGLGNPFGPYGMVLAGDGNLLVSNLNGSVKKYNTTTGAYLGDFVAANSGGLVAPHGITFGTDGNLYVSDFNDQTVKRYNGSTGAYLSTFVSASSGGLTTPTGLRFSPSGDLYVSSTDTNQIKRYNGTTGAFIGNVTAANRPWGIEFAPNGDLYAGTSASSTAAFSADANTGLLKNSYGPSRGGTYIALRTISSAAAPEPSTIAFLIPVLVAGAGIVRRGRKS